MTRVGAATLSRRVEALGEALELLERHVPGDEVDAAAAMLARVRGRMRHGTGRTVVAVAGQTGSGKSSLVNAIVGEDVCPVGVRRPTTSHARAVICGDDPDAGPLLDWLEVRDRHAIAAEGPLSSLVLLDLPDVDSVATDHHLEAHRLIDRVDLLLFVTDPQKYADEVLHDGELRPLAGHAGVLEVILSQVDRLSEDDRVACLQDLARRLAEDGLGTMQPRGVSSVTGAGIEELRGLLADAVRGRRAMIDRLAADVATAAHRLAPGTGADVVAREALPPRPRQQLLDGLAQAIGVDAIVDVVGRQHERDARLATGWPPLRWVTRWRRSPLAAVSAVSRSRVASDQVRACLRNLGEDLGGPGPSPWDRRVRDVARAQQGDVMDGLASITTHDVDALSTRPWWWRAVNGLHGLLLVAAVAGGLWLGGLVIAQSALLLDVADWTPRWRGIPVPTLLLLGGLAVGVLLGLASRLLVRVGTRRRARRARGRLATAIGTLVDDRVAGPVLAVLADRQRVQGLLAVAAGTTGTPLPVTASAGRR